jgi:hypothetical protein
MVGPGRWIGEVDLQHDQAPGREQVDDPCRTPTVVASRSSADQALTTNPVSVAVAHVDIGGEQVPVGAW